MRKIELIKDLEYDVKYEERTTSGGSYYTKDTSWITSLEKTVYDITDLVEVNNIDMVENITKGYINLFTKRGLTATENQKQFAEKTAKILLGQLKDENIIPVIPAPCGFGKSTITQVFLEEICKAYKNDTIHDGMVIITDKIEQLNQLANDLEKEFGYFYEKQINEKYKRKIPFAYVLEGWKEDSYERGVCLNKDIKIYESGMCKECAYNGECKISKQRYEQFYSPILLITNARLKTFGESIDIYSTYVKDDEKYNRNLRIIDEKPELRDNFTVNINLLNEIKNEIYKIKDKDNRRKLIDKWNNIISTIESNKFKDYETYERLLISNINNSPILLNDAEFIELWERCMSKKFKNELMHIDNIIHKGGFYCNTDKGIFINTLGMKELWSSKYKTVIFDATALVDQDYANEDVFKFADIENPRTFENLTFKFYTKHKLTQTEFNGKKYLNEACSKFLNDTDIIKKENTYVVTHSKQSKKILNEIKKKKNSNIILNMDTEWGDICGKVNVITFNDDTLFYFGNTKGSNKAQDCTQMVQFGWNVLPDYEYITRYLSTQFSKEQLDKVFEYCADIKKAENFSEDYFGKDNKNLWELYKNYSLLTDFIQEVFRTKLRQYDCNSDITIHCFQANSILYEMIVQMFPKCKVKYIKEDLECFMESKIDNRVNGDKAQILKNFIIDQWKKDEILKIKDIAEKSGLTKNDIDNLKRKNKYFMELFNKYKTDKNGTYKKVS